MLVTMASHPLTINSLLEDSLEDSPIGSTGCFSWHATPVGIAALWAENTTPTSPPFEAALREGLEVGLDLSREEREFHWTGKGLVLIFHS